MLRDWKQTFLKRRRAVHGRFGQTNDMGIIRFALAMVVVFGHMPGRPFFPMPGPDAVQAFFVISGFYMALILDGKYADLRTFYENRLLRLFPVYWIVAIASAFVMFGFDAAFRVDPADVEGAYAHFWSGAVLILSNITMLGQDILFFFSLSPETGAFAYSPRVTEQPDEIVAATALLAPQAWSLSIELMFYAVAPFLLRRSWKVIAIVALASLALRAGVGEAFGFSPSRWPDKAFPAVLCLFLLGALAYRFGGAVSRIPPAWGVGLQIAILALIVNYNFLFDGADGRIILLPLIAVSLPIIFQTYRNSRIDRFIGDLSYPIYIVHILVIMLADRFVAGDIFWQVTAGTLAASVALLVFVDRPIDKWRQRRVGAS